MTDRVHRLQAESRAKIALASTILHIDGGWPKKFRKHSRVASETVELQKDGVVIESRHRVRLGDDEWLDRMVC